MADQICMDQINKSKKHLEEMIMEKQYAVLGLGSFRGERSAHAGKYGV